MQFVFQELSLAGNSQKQGLTEKTTCCQEIGTGFRMNTKVGPHVKPTISNQRVTANTKSGQDYWMYFPGLPDVINQTRGSL